MMMLNFIDLNDSGGDGFRWTTYRTKNSSVKSNVRDMTSILSFARSHDTLSAGRLGSDPHGWRNALNYYGWGTAALTDSSQRVYDDHAYTSFDAALKEAVTSMARFRKPVGVLARAGHHAQVATGYVVTGEDPSTSDNFVVNGLYVSDPLASAGIVNRYVTRGTLLSGNLRYRFQTYREVDSPMDDPYTAGYRRSSVASLSSEWYRRYVLIVAVRDGVPGPTPTPTPTPTPNPTPTPDPTPTASPTQGSTAASPTPAPAAATAPPAPTATATRTPSQAPSPSEAPSPTAAPSAAPSQQPAEASASPAG
jgi:hypothetical protein